MPPFGELPPGPTTLDEPHAHACGFGLQPRLPHDTDVTTGSTGNTGRRVSRVHRGRLAWARETYPDLFGYFKSLTNHQRELATRFCERYLSLNEEDRLRDLLANAIRYVAENRVKQTGPDT